MQPNMDIVAFTIQTQALDIGALKLTVQQLEAENQRLTRENAGFRAAADQAASQISSFPAVMDIPPSQPHTL